MKKILKFEINKKASKVNQQQKRKVRIRMHTACSNMLGRQTAVAERHKPRASCSRGVPGGSSTRTNRQDFQTWTVQTEPAGSPDP